MEYESQLTEGVFLSRNKRILVNVAISKKEQRTLYCPSILHIPDWQLLGSRVWFSSSNQAHSKYPYTWELMEVSQGDLLYINSAKTHELLIEAIKNHTVMELTGYQTCFHALPIGIHQSQAGMILEGVNQSRTHVQSCPLQFPYSEPSKNCIVMIENVMLYDEIRRAFFPELDALEKKQKIKDLMAARALGYRAVLFCCVQHNRIKRLCLADHIDRTYGQLIRQALHVGVEIYSYGLDISLTQIKIDQPIPLIIPKFALS